MMGRLGLLSVKKATTQLLSSWRNGDHNLFEISTCEDWRKAQKIQIKVNCIFKCEDLNVNFGWINSEPCVLPAL